MPKKRFDTVTTTDRYPASDARGLDVLPFVALWKAPDETMRAEYLTGALSNKTRVDVLDEQLHNGVKWYQVKAYQGGRLQKGWCSVVFLEKLGAEYFRSMV